MGISPYTGSKISHPSSLSTILAHKREAGHPISFDHFSVLTTVRLELDTLIRESLLRELCGKYNLEHANK